MLDPVTIRWTEALFNLAQARGELERVAADVERMESELSDRASAAVLDARLSVAARREQVRPLLRGSSELFRNFVSLLFDKRREEVLRSLPQAFRRRRLQESGGAEGVVESAEPLERAELERIASALGRRLKKDVKLENRVVPELIGGVRVLVENKMLDQSLRGRLDGLRKHLLEVSLPLAR
jgi:F-type H+-transporting ATPase subunit delta